MPFTKNTKNADFKKTVPPAAPWLLAPLAPLRVKIFLGGFWHLSQLKFEEILPKIPRMQILRKLSPLLPPPPPLFALLAPLAPLGIKTFLGGFWHLSQLKFEEISPKIPRMQNLRKQSPPAAPRFTHPPGPPGSQKFFGGVSGIYICPTHPT